MVLSDVCISRPVFATVLNILLVLLGLVAYQRLSVREYPRIEETVVTVTTTYPGANAEIVESQVTKIMEEQLAGIEGIELMTSISRSESSQISLKFKISRDPDNAASDVRDRVSRARNKLPEDVEEPVIAKTEADAQPIIYLAFYSDRHDRMFISDYADRFVKDRLRNLDGVADVQILGERRPAMRLWLEPERLAAFQITPQDVENALRSQNVEIPAGRIESKAREFSVLSQTDLRTPEQFDNLIIKREGARFVRFRDIGRAEIAPKQTRGGARFMGQETVALGVVKQATANPLTVSEGVRGLLPSIASDVPEGMQVQVAYDSSVFIDRSITNVYETLGEAILLVVLVIFLFLRNLRATLIPLVTIPVSLVGTFMMMYVLGFSINTLTLLALVLAIGLVVDDSIVVLENIYRHVEEGLSPLRAAFQGSREIAFAVIAMSLTLAAVFAPMGFLEGRTGKLFTEFALTLAGAVLISGFTALTLSPMLCSLLLQAPTKRHSWFYNIIEYGLNGLNRGYRGSLRFALRHRIFTLLIGLAVAASTVALFRVLKSELTPVEESRILPASDPAYLRADSSLLVAFSSMPQIEIPPQKTAGKSRIFELRTYESHSKPANLKKIQMFDEGEIGIFRRTGLTPVFFGDALIGGRLPNLTYMLVFDDMSARDVAWRTFVSDPEWQKLSTTPGYTDPEIITDITNVLLRPAAYSQL